MIHWRSINFCFHAFSFSFHFHTLSCTIPSHLLWPSHPWPLSHPLTPLTQSPLGWNRIIGFSQYFNNRPHHINTLWNNLKSLRFFFMEPQCYSRPSHSVLVEFQNIHCRLICWGIFVITTFQSFSVAYDSVIYDSVNLKFNFFHI